MRQTLLYLGTILATFALIALLSSCSISDASLTTSAENYVRLTEYSAKYPLVGGITGCQLSQEGEMGGDWKLQTENCTAQSNGSAR